jgi:hypothetical protein
VRRDEQVAIAYKLLLMHGLERTYARLKFCGSYCGQILPGKGLVPIRKPMCRTLHIKHDIRITVSTAASQLF